MVQVLNENALRTLVKDVFQKQTASMQKEIERLYEHISDLRQEIQMLQGSIENMSDKNGY